MKKLVATLLVLVMISTCSVGLASNSNINSFVNNLLDALNNFNIDSQALQGAIYEPNTSGSGSGYHYPGEEVDIEAKELGSMLIQKKGGMYQMRVYSEDMQGNAAALEFNDQLIRVQMVEESYDYSTYSTKRETVTYELRYEDIQEIIDQTMSLMNTMLALMGVDIDLDAIADIDYDAIADALAEFVTLVIQHSARTEKDAEGNTVARFYISELNVYEAADEWIDLFLNNTRWQDAFVDIGSMIIDSFGSMMGSFDESLDFIGDLNLGELLSSRSTICDALRQLREEQLRPILTQAQSNPKAVFDLQFAVAPSGEFAYMTMDVADNYGNLERFIDVRYEGSDLIAKLGTDGREKVKISSSDASRLDMEYSSGSNVYWTGYATQSGSGNSWSLKIFDTYSFRGSPNTAGQCIFTLQTTGQQPFESLADAPNLIRINWNWFLQNVFGGSSGSRYY